MSLCFPFLSCLIKLLLFFLYTSNTSLPAQRPQPIPIRHPYVPYIYFFLLTFHYISFSFRPSAHTSVTAIFLLVISSSHTFLMVGNVSYHTHLPACYPCPSPPPPWLSFQRIIYKISLLMHFGTMDAAPHLFMPCRIH